MSGATTAVAIGAVVASTAATLYSGNQQRIAASRAADQADEAMKAQQQAAQQALEQQQRESEANLAQAQSASDAQLAQARATADATLKQQQDASAASIAVQEKAIQASQDATLKTQTMQQEAINRQNAKTPDVSALLSANQQAAKGGAGSTMLTGTQGVDPTTLSLSKSSLLGA